MRIKHHLSRLYHEHERVKIILLLGAIFASLIFISINIFEDSFYLGQPVKFGVSFSPTYAAALGLEPKQVYRAILEDLEVKNIRIPAYWNEIEPIEGKFDFAELDYYISEAEKHQAKVILAVGYKLFRWPECRSPGWLALDSEKVREEKIMNMLKAVIGQYNNNEVVSAFQLENEPYLPFGVCPGNLSKFFPSELALVRTLTKKPVIITDSGELRDWIAPAQMADYFGTTIYRKVNAPIVSTFHYPLKPWFYRLKANFVKAIFAPSLQKLLVAELQAEPWETEFMSSVPLEKQIKDFPLSAFQANVLFAKKVDKL